MFTFGILTECNFDVPFCISSHYSVASNDEVALGGLYLASLWFQRFDNSGMTEGRFRKDEVLNWTFVQRSSSNCKYGSGSYRMGGDTPTEANMSNQIFRDSMYPFELIYVIVLAVSMKWIPWAYRKLFNCLSHCKLSSRRVYSEMLCKIICFNKFSYLHHRPDNNILTQNHRNSIEQDVFIIERGNNFTGNENRTDNHIHAK